MTTITTIRRAMTRVAAPARLAGLADDEFEGYASLFGVPDGAGDVVAPGAFAASLRKRPPGKVRMLYQHVAAEPLGVWLTIREDGRGLYVRGRLVLDVTRSREVRALIREGALDGLSIGFRTRQARRDAKSGLRTLTEIDLWEISIVTFPLLPGSEVVAVGKGSDLARLLRKAGRDVAGQTRPCPAASLRVPFLPPFTGEASAEVPQERRRTKGAPPPSQAR